MPVLSTTARGQVTLRKEIFQHIGIRPGEKLDIELMPGGEIRGRALRRKGKIADTFGMLAGKSKVKLTIEQINEAIADAAAEAGRSVIQR